MKTKINNRFHDIIIIDLRDVNYHQLKYDQIITLMGIPIITKPIVNKAIFEKNEQL